MVPPETPGTGDLEAVQSGVLFEPLPLLRLEYHHPNRCLRTDSCVSMSEGGSGRPPLLLSTFYFETRSLIDPITYLFTGKTGSQQVPATYL